MPGNALFLFERSGKTAEPWAAAGYTCYCVDIAHSIRRERVVGNLRFVWGDVRSWCPPDRTRFDFIAAMPPCTHVTGSGARDWKRKGHFLLIEALELWTAAQTVAAYSGAPYMIENPVGALSRHMREADFIIEPWHYAGYAADPTADAYTKKTCLWVGGGFVMPNRKPVEPQFEKIHSMPPSDDRAVLRSETPSGFARAVFLANAPHLKAQAA